MRTSEAFAPCVQSALESFGRGAGVASILEVRDLDDGDGVDVIIGDDSELTRLLEGGWADLSTASDLGQIPWVLTSPAGSRGDVRAAASAGAPVAVLDGVVAREVRRFLGATLAPSQVRLSRDREELRRAAVAVVPRTLADPGQGVLLDVRPLVMVAVAAADSPNGAKARELLTFLQEDGARELLSSCGVAPASKGEVVAISDSSASIYATSVVDWWLPRCSLERNGYNDPKEVLGPPDALQLTGRDNFSGIMSLGMGGYVTVDMGVTVVNGPGADVRVFQMVSGEPVTLYAAASPKGPFTLVGLQVWCGNSMPGMGQIHHCDFDLQDAGLTEARYLKVEDGEIYPCLEAGTMSEGADIDAVQALNWRR